MTKANTFTPSQDIGLYSQTLLCFTSTISKGFIYDYIRFLRVFLQF
ncbi:hypothetical protein E2C01_033666 [Portunus trituberculatus]|uniref:Uncharacterized protein n=1 Tax=Portunus trituberculatus TaxID=210409 RepID=A0A5B7F0Q6_PORTR|nr:hypothetical protein [Portunus trituberculatus]